MYIDIYKVYRLQNQNFIKDSVIGRIQVDHNPQMNCF